MFLLFDKNSSMFSKRPVNWWKRNFTLNKYYAPFIMILWIIEKCVIVAFCPLKNWYNALKSSSGLVESDGHIGEILWKKASPQWAVWRLSESCGPVERWRGLVLCSQNIQWNVTLNLYQFTICFGTILKFISNCRNFFSTGLQDLYKGCVMFLQSAISLLPVHCTFWEII